MHRAHVHVPGASVVKNRAARNLSNWQHFAEPDEDYIGLPGIIGAVSYSLFFGFIGAGAAWISLLCFACSQPLLGIFTAILAIACAYLVTLLIFSLIRYLIGGLKCL